MAYPCLLSLVVFRNRYVNPMSRKVSAKNNMIRSVFIPKKTGPGGNRGRKPKLTAYEKR